MTHKGIALVTGASAGFGKAITYQLVQDGYKIIAVARRKEKLEQLSHDFPDQIYPVVMDMTDTRNMETTIHTLPPEWQEIDVLVNNAGLALGVDRIPNISLSNWDQMIKTNVIGLIHLTQIIIGGMLDRKKGHIISLGSIAGTYPYPGGNVYGATKAFVAQFMLNLKTDLIGTPIRVTNIEPGLCGGTEFSDIRLKDHEKAQAVYEGTTPLTADDIAKTISWVVGLPAHVNINRIEMMPVCQAPAGVAVFKSIK
ncbi:SDR family NAD(P)-dependent oxidoreductase [Commensalibacter papalotli (ex Servin-Garciduenas et al. 2014)]|uniref:NADP-dependent L-serine/L-allo-threonine dehydrogenase n=1 Tax=Commensalibacter papalotli (ex Servin-Garciduenas et al. 2014) TaxID=1208583 RepID=W7E7E3_9PROT|nr:SDR family NAD(P)-dependent oxidoreductase [Commensalibacter papalotli (ex Servin-Garciduenas et al. 2014)]EUK19091.1 NADP-dependent L-serine/L-allo-threonine dehydrogenase [Commensalibacter papalotli (ex Servin-Garciduenas et al. 2014)]